MSVRDSKDDNGNTDTATDDEITVTITVTNANEPPAFSGATATLEVPENTAANTDIRRSGYGHRPGRQTIP